MTHWLLGKILLLQKLKTNIDQENKVEEVKVPLIGLSKKVISHGFKKKDDLSLEKEVIMRVRVPSSYGSSLCHCFIMEDHLSGLKSHDHLNFLRVRMSKHDFIICYYFYAMR